MTKILTVDQKSPTSQLMGIDQSTDEVTIHHLLHTPSSIGAWELGEKARAATIEASNLRESSIQGRMYRDINTRPRVLVLVVAGVEPPKADKGKGYPVQCDASLAWGLVLVALSTGLCVPESSSLTLRWKILRFEMWLDMISLEVVAAKRWNKWEVVSLRVVIYNLLIDGLCKDKHVNEVFKIFYDVIRKGIKPDVVTYNYMILGVCNFATMVLEFMDAQASDPMLSVIMCCNSTLLDGLCEDEHVDEVSCCFLKFKDVGYLSMCDSAHYGYFKKYDCWFVVVFYYNWDYNRLRASDMTGKLDLLLSQVKPICPTVSILLIPFADLELVLSVQISVFFDNDTLFCHIVLLNNYG
ncbi:hypothetical protein LguiB_027211 [Lonicera macranthoides]